MTPGSSSFKCDSNGTVQRRAPVTPIAAALSQEDGFTSHLRSFLTWFNARKPVMKKTSKTKTAALPPPVHCFLEEVVEARLARWAEPERQEIKEAGEALVGTVHGPKMVGEEVRVGTFPRVSRVDWCWSSDSRVVWPVLWPPVVTIGSPGSGGVFPGFVSVVACRGETPPSCLLAQP